MSLHKAYWSVVYFPLENFIWLWYKDKAEASLKKGVKFKNKIKLKKKKELGGVYSSSVFLNILKMIAVNFYLSVC